MPPFQYGRGHEALKLVCGRNICLLILWFLISNLSSKLNRSLSMKVRCLYCFCLCHNRWTNSYEFVSEYMLWETVPPFFHHLSSSLKGRWYAIVCFFQFVHFLDFFFYVNNRLWFEILFTTGHVWERTHDLWHTSQSLYRHNPPRS